MPPNPEITRDSLQIARLEEQMNTMRRDMEDMSRDMKLMQMQLSSVLDKLTEARGGWKLLMLLGGAGAALGSSVPWLVNHIKVTP